MMSIIQTTTTKTTLPNATDESKKQALKLSLDIQSSERDRSSEVLLEVSKRFKASKGFKAKMMLEDGTWTKERTR
jgi:hypothetical protein